MTEITLERIWERYGNKYIFLALASKETRKLIEAISEGKIDTVDNPYRLGIQKAFRGDTDTEP